VRGGGGNGVCWRRGWGGWFVTECVEGDGGEGGGRGWVVTECVGSGDRVGATLSNFGPKADI
jgi:hypothetical protein